MSDSAVDQFLDAQSNKSQSSVWFGIFCPALVECVNFPIWVFRKCAWPLQHRLLCPVAVSFVAACSAASDKVDLRELCQVEWIWNLPTLEAARAMGLWERLWGRDRIFFRDRFFLQVAAFVFIRNVKGRSHGTNKSLRTTIFETKHLFACSFDWAPKSME